MLLDCELSTASKLGYPVIIRNSAMPDTGYLGLETLMLDWLKHFTFLIKFRIFGNNTKSRKMYIAVFFNVFYIGLLYSKGYNLYN